MFFAKPTPLIDGVNAYMTPDEYLPHAATTVKVVN